MSANGRPRARFGETEAQRAARLKQYKRSQRIKVVGNILLVLGVVAGVSLLVALFLALGAAVFLVAWNVGVVHLVAAAGGHVASIGFWTALGGSLAVSIVRGLLHGSTTINKEV